MKYLPQSLTIIFILLFALLFFPQPVLGAYGDSCEEAYDFCAFKEYGDNFCCSAIQQGNNVCNYEYWWRCNPETLICDYDAAIYSLDTVSHSCTSLLSCGICYAGATETRNLLTCTTNPSTCAGYQGRCDQFITVQERTCNSDCGGWSAWTTIDEYSQCPTDSSINCGVCASPTPTPTITPTPTPSPTPSSTPSPSCVLDWTTAPDNLNAGQTYTFKWWGETTRTYNNTGFYRDKGTTSEVSVNYNSKTDGTQDGKSCKADHPCWWSEVVPAGNAGTHTLSFYINSGSTLCTQRSFTTISPTPTAPTVTVTPACIDNPVSTTSDVTISWTNQAGNNPVSYVDISPNSDFNPLYNKAVSSTTTTAPNGFYRWPQPAGGPEPLTLSPNTTYYVRLYNDYHSPTVSFSIPGCPKCSSAGPQGWTTTATSGTKDFFAYGVENTTGVKFPTWSSVNGQDDIIWYEGVNLGGPGEKKTWKGTIDLSNHRPGNPDYGTIYVHVYLFGAGPAVFCGSANFTRTLTSPITPWIQVWGDVHSNTAISAPGGP